MSKATTLVETVEFVDKWGRVKRVTWPLTGTYQQTEWPSKRGRRYLAKHGYPSPADKKAG